MRYPGFVHVFGLSLLTAIILLACGGGGGGGIAPSNGLPSTVVTQSMLPPGDINCPDGGILLEYGIDDNLNGFLNTSEVDGVEYICHGTNGLLSIVNSSTLMSGNINCPAGGLRIDTGLDINLDEVLQGDEISGSTFICKEEVTGPGLTVTQASNSQLDLAWYGLGVGEPVEDYLVYENGVLLVTLANSASSYSHAELGPDTLHCYRVVGVDLSGLAVVQTDEICATTGYDAEPPSAPVLSLEQSSSTRFRLDWQEPTDNIGVSGYNIYRDGQYAVTAVTNSYSDEGLSFMSTYCYAVTAYDAAGNESLESNTACATLEVVDITNSTPYWGHVDTSWSALVANVTPGTVYEVSLTRLTADADLYVYDNDPTFTNPISCYVNYGTNDENCRLIATGDRLQISVSGARTLSGSQYRLDLKEVSVPDVAVSVPYDGSVERADSVFYSVSVTPGMSYIVNMTGLKADASLALYDSGFDFNSSPICYSNKSGTMNEICSIVPTGDTLYIGVSTSRYAYEGTAFMLDVAVNPNQDEGTFGAPVDVTGKLPYAGQVADYSYYSMDVIPGQAYDVSLTGLTDSLYLYVYNASDFTYEQMRCSVYTAGTVASCTLGVTGPKMYIKVYAYNDVAGTGYTLDVTPSTRVDEGSAGSPIDITGLTPYVGTVGLTASYYVNTVTPGEGYLISMTEVAGSANLMVYGDDASFTNSICSPMQYGSSSEYCAVTATSGAMYIKVDGSFNGGGFTLNMTASSLLAEGTAASPVNITGSVPYAGTVDSTASYYVNTVTPGEGYLISLTGMNYGANLTVYGDDSTFTAPLCSSANSYTSSEYCAVTATSGAMYIKVDGAPLDKGSGFTMGFGPSTILAEGTAASPVDITGSVPYTGTVDSTASYYVNTVTPGEGYIIRLTGIDKGARLAVYGDDAAFSTPLCSSASGGTSDKVCTVTASSSAMYVKVYGAPTATGSGFTIDFAPTTNVSEGSAGSPMSLDGLMPHHGTVDSTASYYVSTVTPGEQYLISMTGITMNRADLYVYADDTVFSSPSCSVTYMLDSKFCVVTATSGQMYIKVDGQYTETGAGFDLGIEVNANLTEGSIAAPADITGLSPYQGGVGKSYSYYYTGGLTPGAEYAVTLSGLNDKATLYVYDNPDFSGSFVCSRDGMAGQDTGCIVTPTGSELSMSVYGYYSQAGTVFTLGVEANANLDEGSKASPVNITGLTPYSGTVNDYDSNGGSFYINAATPGKVYEVTLTGLTGDAALNVYTEGFIPYYLACSSNNTGTQDEKCLVTASLDKLYINVMGVSATGAEYVLEVKEAALATYYIETVPNDSGSGADTYLRLYDSNINLVAYDDDRGPGLYSQLQASLVSGETYYIQVLDKYYKQDFYSIRISAVGFDGTSATGTATAPDSYETDNNSASATGLTLETWQHHSLSYGEADWFVFTAP